MGITEDQNKLRQQNINYLKIYCTEFFENRFNELNNYYKKIIKQNVFDTSDKDEVNMFLKKEFQKLNNEVGFGGSALWFFNSISISNNAFVYDLEEFIKNAISSQLVNNIYPVLEEQLKYITLAEFYNWRLRLKITSQKVFVKYLLKENNTLQQKDDEKTSYPFKDVKYIKGLKEYQKQITVAYNDYSYLFQRLLILEYIHPIKHLQFMKWLYDNNHIKEFEYKDLYTKGGFYSLKKSYSEKREQNFNVAFEL